MHFGLLLVLQGVCGLVSAILVSAAIGTNLYMQVTTGTVPSTTTPVKTTVGYSLWYICTSQEIGFVQATSTCRERYNGNTEEDISALFQFIRVITCSSLGLIVICLVVGPLHYAQFLRMAWTLVVPGVVSLISTLVSAVFLLRQFVSTDSASTNMPHTLAPSKQAGTSLGPSPILAFVALFVLIFLNVFGILAVVSRPPQEEGGDEDPKPDIEDPAELNFSAQNSHDPADDEPDIVFNKDGTISHSESVRHRRRRSSSQESGDRESTSGAGGGGRRASIHSRRSSVSSLHSDDAGASHSGDGGSQRRRGSLTSRSPEARRNSAVRNLQESMERSRRRRESLRRSRSGSRTSSHAVTPHSENLILSDVVMMDSDPAFRSPGCSHLSGGGGSSTTRAPIPEPGSPLERDDTTGVNNDKKDMQLESPKEDNESYLATTERPSEEGAPLEDEEL